MNRVRGVPARTEQIAATTAALPAHLDVLGARVSAEAARVQVDIADRLLDLAGLVDAVSALGTQAQSHHDAARQLQDSIDVVRAELQRLDVIHREATAASLNEMAVSRHELAVVRHETAVSRQEMTVQMAGLRDALAAVDHRARVGLEASLAARRDAAFETLCAGLERREARVDGLSVMVITWNHAGWLPEALESAIAALEALPAGQAGQILVLDDGSSDETAILLESLQGDARFQIVRSPSNLGLSRARNVLLSICETRHAVILDADNRILAEGTRVLYQTARSLRPTITWGHVIAATPDATDWQAYAYAPSPESLRTSHCFDSMCVIDVESVERLGGYTRDPQLAGVADDFELLLRCLRNGELVGFVPVVLGRYRISPHRHSAQVADQRLIEARLARAYLYDDPDLDRCSIVGAHPEAGVLWASSGAVDRYGIRPPAPTTPGEPVRPRKRILVVAPGGVGNIGDDAITDAVVRRVRRLHPQACIEVVSDREVPVTSSPVPWAGTVIELWQSLTDDDLDCAESAAGGISRERLMSQTRVPGSTPLSSFDAAIFAGGGHLASPFGSHLLRPRVTLALALAGHGIPVVWTGQGIGPCSGEELELIGAAIRAADSFGCRDAGSIDAVGEDVRARLTLTGDDAMGFDTADDETVQSALRRAGVETDRYIVLHVRRAEYVGESDLSELLRAVDALATERGATVLGLCINDNEPAEAAVFAHAAQVAPRRAKWRAIEATRSPALVRGLVANADAVISHSYHLALWALQARTPALLVAGSDYYRAKAEGLSDLAGFGGTIALDPGAGVNVDVIRTGLDAVSTWLASSLLPAAAARVEQWSEECLGAILDDGGNRRRNVGALSPDDD